MEWRPSSAVHRRTQVPHALSRAEHPHDVLGVIGEVVLGQQVHEERTAYRRGQVDLVGIPDLVTGEVAPPAPRHDLVREPLLGAGEMALEQPGCFRLEFAKQGIAFHGPSVPTYWSVGNAG